jgi:hypothetical protein
VRPLVEGARACLVEFHFEGGMRGTEAESERERKRKERQRLRERQRQRALLECVCKTIFVCPVFK